MRAAARVPIFIPAFDKVDHQLCERAYKRHRYIAITNRHQPRHAAGHAGVCLSYFGLRLRTVRKRPFWNTPLVDLKGQQSTRSDYLRLKPAFRLSLAT